MISFYKDTSTRAVINYLAETISRRLQAGQRVLWLLSGGSAIEIEVATAGILKSKPNPRNLTITLIDERFGPAGHADSNFEQLLTAGFSLPGATLRPVLGGRNFEQTAEDWKRGLEDELNGADYALGVAGIGTDGHTLGIKPGSPALSARELVVGYDWQDYRRLTTTAELIKRLDEIVVFAMGAEKKEQLERLKQALPPEQQPAQLLKLCSKVTIFNDQLASD